MKADFVALGDVARVDSGPAFRSAMFRGPGEGVRLVRGDNIEPGGLRWTRTKTWPQSELAGYEHLFLGPDDLILGMDRPVISSGLKLARVRPTDLPALLVQRVARIRPVSIERDYLYHWLSSPEFARHLQGHATGTQLPHVTLKSIRAYPVPRFGDQSERRIVELLEDQLTRLDAAQGSISKSLRRLSALRDSGLAQAVAEAHASPDVVVSELGFLAKVSSGMTPLKANRAFYDNGTIPWITSGDLHQGCITRATQFVTEKALDETTLKVLPAGTLLIAMYGEGKTRGTAAELSIDATTNQACAAVALHDSALRPWVRLVLDANYSKLRRLAAGGVQPNLNLSVVKAIQIPIPAPEVRDQLLARRVELDDANARLQSQLNIAHRRGCALRRSLLAAVFSGRLAQGRSLSEQPLALTD